jgi:hypothetical protein
MRINSIRIQYILRCAFMSTFLTSSCPVHLLVQITTFDKMPPPPCRLRRTPS